MDDKIKSFLDIALQFADASDKKYGAVAHVFHDDALKHGYLHAKYKAEGYDAVMKVGMQERNDYYESWYALRGTPEELARFYHRNMVEVDFDESDDVSYCVQQVIDLHRPVGGYPENVQSPLWAAINDPATKAQAALSKEEAPSAQASMCRGAKEMAEDGVFPVPAGYVPQVVTPSQGAQPLPPQ